MSIATDLHYDFLEKLYSCPTMLTLNSHLNSYTNNATDYVCILQAFTMTIIVTFPSWLYDTKETNRFTSDIIGRYTIGWLDQYMPHKKNIALHSMCRELRPQNSRDREAVEINYYVETLGTE